MRHEKPKSIAIFGYNPKSQPRVFKKGQIMKILIVDDEYVSRKKAEKLLSEFGDCDVATDGIEAYEMFVQAHQEDNPYDLITMDIVMPDMDGISALKNIREFEKSNKITYRKGVKIIMLTMADDSDTMFSSFYELCGAYIVKPITKEKLVNAINQLE